MADLTQSFLELEHGIVCNFVIFKQILNVIFAQVLEVGKLFLLL